MEGYISSSEAAQIIGCVDSRVRQLLRANSIRGRRVGRDWLVERASAEEYARTERKPGRRPAGEGSAAGA